MAGTDLVQRTCRLPERATLLQTSDRDRIGGGLAAARPGTASLMLPAGLEKSLNGPHPGHADADLLMI